jgi:hypothetical protein
MTKWVAVLMAGFVTLVLLSLVAIPFIYGEPIRPSYFILVALFLCSTWWLFRTIKAPSRKVSEPHLAEARIVPARETFFMLLGILGLIPWAFIWVLVIAPLVGLGSLPVKVHLIPVLGIYAAGWAILARRR